MFAAGLLVALTLVVYVPAMRAGFIWDDDTMLTENRLVHASDGLYYFWLTTDPVDYYPLTWTARWIQWRLWGPDPAGYHVVNIVLHALSAVVLWRVLRRLQVPGAYVAAAVFAVHPVTVASVAWITEQKNTLSLLLMALSMLAFLRFEGGGRRWLYVAALVAFLMALLAKTAVVMMPVALLVLAWGRRGRIARVDLVRVAPFLVLSLGLGLVTVYYEYQHSIGFNVPRPEGVFSRLAASGWCVWFYLYKALLPIHLAMVYPRWAVDPAWLPAWVPLLGLLAGATVAWPFRRGPGRFALVALGCFVAMLLPVLGFSQMAFHRHSLVSDHLQYVGLIVPVALVVAGAAVLFRRWRAGRWLAPTAAVLILAALSGLTWSRARVFHDPQTLWPDTLKRNPEAWVAYANLGTALARAGRNDQAIDHFRQALHGQPGDPMTHCNLGIALRKEGQVDEAIDHYRRALQIQPRYIDAQYNLAVALQTQGDLDEAAFHYREVLEVDPGHVKALNNLGVVLYAQGKLAEAIGHYQRALQSEPDSAEVHYNLARVLQRQGRLDAAISHFRHAVRIEPGSARAHAGLRDALAAQENLD